MMLGLVLALALAQGSSSMAGPHRAAVIRLTPSQSIATEGCVRGAISDANIDSTTVFSTSAGNMVSINSAAGTTNALFSYDGATSHYGNAVSAIAGRSDVPVRADWSETNDEVGIAADNLTDTKSSPFAGTFGAGPVYIGSGVGVVQFLYGYIRSVRLGTSPAGCQP